MYRPIVQLVITIFALQCGASAAAADLVVSAAASLSNAFTEIGHEFESTHADAKVLLNFGGSGQLLQQIANGAPVDVFASADQETMDQAQARDVIEPDSRFNFARNALVVVVPIDAKRSVTSLDDLIKDEIRRVAIGHPESVPVGRYSKAALTASGRWKALEPKVINTSNVRQSLDYVARGEVDAAFVYRTDAAIRGDKVRIALEVPTMTPILYPIATVKTAGNKAGAREFAAFVHSPEVRKILRKYGFLDP
ncbi:MAG: molybdate ABC transporter substrate-binding protein [Betaproteobacteria bacterium]|jgi:molybdate transport system substrate-binding protein